jgi:diguanylate cyclase (GGDEF)-like protein
MLSKYKNSINNIAQPNKHIMDEIIRININRVFFLSIVSISARLFSIITFLNKVPAGQNEKIWRIGILVSHITYLVLLIILSILSYKQRKNNKPSFVTTATQYFAIVLILFFGILITSIDQLVTPSITPFLIACISIGAIFIIKPSYTLLIFILGYILYYFAMGIVQSDLPILLSNRLNGFTSIIFGIFLSLVLWKSNVINLQLKEQIFLQQKELEEKNKELQHLATHDSLTVLFNRRYFEEKASHEIQRIKRHGEDLCLLVLDIDNFKDINDKYGHPIGDKVLQGLAFILKTQLREIDIVSRIGGEEFAIILIGTDAKAGKIVAEKLRNNIENELFIIDYQEINITVSIGITSIDDRIDSYEEAYEYADKALYIAKTKGKNKVVI